VHFRTDTWHHSYDGWTSCDSVALHANSGLVPVSSYVQTYLDAQGLDGACACCVPSRIPSRYGTTQGPVTLPLSMVALDVEDWDF